MKLFYFALLFSFSFLFSDMCRAQLLCRGILLDSLSGQPIEFANMGMPGNAIGTVTSERGGYSFTVPDSLSERIIRISMIGYRPRTITAKQLAARSGMTLAPNTTTFKEVAVSAKKLKVKILGNHTRTRAISGGFAQGLLGSELAVKLDVKQPNTHLRKFYVHINSNEIESPVFRFNLYSVDEKGWPKDNLLTKNIFIEVKGKTGLVELDLTPYNLYVSEDVFIAMEWIKDMGDAKKIMISTKLVGSPTYYKLTSEAKWEKMPAGIGLHAEVAY